MKTSTLIIAGVVLLGAGVAAYVLVQRQLQKERDASKTDWKQIAAIAAAVL